MKSKSLLFLVLFIGITTFSFAQSPIGIWKTIDDETGKEKSQVEIYEENGKLHGKVIKLLDAPSDICSTCSGDRKNQQLVGMKIMWNMSKSGSTWKGGKIFSPTKDTEYRCKLWFDDKSGQELKVRGYVYAFYRTQTWHRIK